MCWLLSEGSSPPKVIHAAWVPAFALLSLAVLILFASPQVVPLYNSVSLTLVPPFGAAPPPETKAAVFVPHDPPVCF